MPFAEYTDGVTTVSAIQWDGSDSVADEVVYYIPGVSVHTNTIGATVVKELRFAAYLTIPQGDWLAISVAEGSVTALHITTAAFAAYTAV
jgi:hypothetical protein